MRDWDVVHETTAFAHTMAVAFGAAAAVEETIPTTTKYLDQPRGELEFCLRHTLHETVTPLKPCSSQSRTMALSFNCFTVA